MLRDQTALQFTEPLPALKKCVCPVSGRLLRVLFIIPGLLAMSSTIYGGEPAQRLFPTAPTDYRRSTLTPQHQFTQRPVTQRPVTHHQASDRRSSNGLASGNAEADIPRSHLLYRLHSPPDSSVVQQAGGQMDSAAATGVVQAGGVMDSSPHVTVGHFLPDTESVIEHITVAPEWTADLSLGSDLNRAWGRLRDDTSGVLHPNNLVLFGLAGGAAVALRQNSDERVRHYTATHPKHWDRASDVFGELGYVTVQIPVLLGSYYWGLHTQNRELHDFNATLFSAFTINGTGTLLIKAAANTDRPSENFNGGRFGFPSYHASSSFTIASVLDEYYGHRVGLPAYALAGVIAWSRVNSRDHDLSDVVFGSAMGFVIGKSVARHHLVGDSRVQILPWIEPVGGTSGLQLSMHW